MRFGNKTTLIAILLNACVTIAPTAVKGEVQTVPQVDLDRYLGTWYEIAAIPQRFQRQCTRNTRAEYSQSESQTIAVTNSCETASGARSIAEGRARVFDRSSNAKLKVTFVRLLGKWVYLFGGDYWIVDLHPDYEYVVVGHPNRDYGWILARSPAIADEDLKGIAERLTSVQGYDICNFKMTQQDGGYRGNGERLCDHVNSL